MAVSEGGLGRFVGDRYHIVRELGRGGMGVVYLGRDLRRDMDVAIKVRGQLHHDATLWLKREFRAVASLRHRNLVELYELVAHEGSCYFTMEYLPGVDPRRWVERAVEVAWPPGSSDRTTHSAVPIQEARTEVSLAQAAEAAQVARRPAPVVDFARLRIVLAQLAEGLAFLHARGVIHRDVKPSNAIVLEDGSVKLLDFGLALERRRAVEDLSRETKIVGTAAYLAPEYVERLDVSPAMDAYALGVLAFELATGAPPFGGTMRLLSRLSTPLAVPRASTIAASIPPELDDLIADLLGADPATRPSADDVVARLTGNVSRPRVPAHEARFVGRVDELARLEELLADRTPRGRLVVLRGPSGAGKSALTDAAVARARGALAWRGRCHERERVPYRAFDLIIDDLATTLADLHDAGRAIEHAAAVARVFPTLAPALGAAHANEPAAGDLRVERDRALIAMTQLFGELLGDAPGVITIEDLQWADDDSLELLALIVERIARPLTVIASWTLEAAGAEPAGLSAIRTRLGEAASVIELAAMPEAELGELIAELAPQLPTAQIATAARLAAGSPYLAELIGRELATTDVAEVGDAEVAEIRRLARLAGRERAVAEVAALAGGTVGFEQLRALAQLSAAQLQSVLRGLEQERIVRAMPAASGDAVYGFYHQRLRDAAHAAMSAEARRKLHRRFAAWHDKHGADKVALAYHWGEAGEAALAARAALAAGDAARAQLAWALAEDWYARALAFGALDPAGTNAARAGRAECLFLAGRLAAAADQLEALAEPGAAGDHWRVRAAEARIKLGELDRGLALLDGVLARRGQPRTRVRAISALRAIAVAARWLVPTGRTPKPPAVDGRGVSPAGSAAAARHGSGDDVLAAAYRVIASFMSTPQPIESLEYVLRGVVLAERSGDRAAHGMGMAMLGAYLATGSLGRFGDRAIARAHELSAHSDSPYPHMVASGATGILATLRGNWDAMRSAHEAAEAICHRLGLERSWEASFLRTYWALGEYYAGEPTRALHMLGELAEASEDLISRAMLGSFRGRALVLDGDLAAARAAERELAHESAARHGLASIYRQVFSGELALAERDWSRAIAVGCELAANARAQWLSAMPAVSAMIDVLLATAEIGAGGRASAKRARDRARGLVRRSRVSFYAATALRLWSQAEARLERPVHARQLLARAAVVANERGGKLDRLAIAALAGEAHDPGRLAAAITWSTGGVIL